MNRKILVLILTCLLIIIIGFTIYLSYSNHQKSEPEVISTYNNPIVPEGFKSVDTETAKWTKQDDGTIKDWNKGLVIEDSIGNQFVWIPINLDDLHYDSYYLSEKDQYSKDNLNTEDEEDLQILKYGGFYIGRYEAGVPKELQSNLENISEETNNISGIPVSQKGVIPWNYISFKNAKQNAENMYQSDTIRSSLLSNKQWNGIMQWLNECGYNVYSNSFSWGNYSNVNFEFTGYYSINHGKSYQYGKETLKTKYNMILSCGSTDRNMANNIYDLAGNLAEYTLENDAKGGYYDYIDQGTYGGGSYIEPSNQIGFRVVLFIN